MEVENAEAVKPLIPTPGLLRQKSFWLFWLSRVMSAIGFQGAFVVFGWRIYELTHSAYALGLVGLAAVAPMLLFNFVVGQVADRFNRKRIVMYCQALEFLTLMTLAFGVAGNWLGVGGLYAAVFMLGACRSFEGPTITAILPAIVSETNLPRAMAMSTSAAQTAIIIGPSLGGLLYGFNPSLPFLICGLSFAAASSATGWLHVKRAIPSKEPLTLHSVFAGVSFIRSRPVILGTMSLDLFAGLLGGVTSLLPIFAHDILHTGPWGAGLLRSSPAVGALAMSLVLARYNIKRHVGLKMFISVILFGLMTVSFALSTNILVSCLSLAVLGAADMISVVIRNSLVLLNTPDHMRGRVNAMNFLFIGMSNQLGDFESGMVAGLVGAVPAAALGGAATIALAVLWMRMFPRLRRADKFHD